MESEQLQSFNDRLSQWISNQGFWFQLRFSMSGGGASSVLFHLLRIGFRVLLFLILAGIGGWIYLYKRVEAKDFPRKLTESIGHHVGASESRIEGFSRCQGEFNLRRIACVGGPDAFYNGFEAGNITCRMGLLDGLTGIWRPGPMRIKRLDMEIRTGANDAESAARRGEAFLKSFPKFELSTIEVSEASLHWGFAKIFDPRIRAGLTEPARGGIIKSKMTVQRTETGYRLLFQGGTFSQNWLEELEIVELTATIGPEGIQIEKGEFLAKVSDDTQRPVGTVSMLGVKVSGGDRPQVSGTVSFKRVPLEMLLPARVQGFVEGSISCDLKLSGSTNTSDGVGYEGQVVMNGEDCITLRERIHLFKALSVVDVFNSYRKLDFRDGSFHLKASAGALSLENVNLKASDVMTLEGGLKVRLPNDQEIEKSVTHKSNAELTPLFSSDNTIDELDTGKKESEFTLKSAAENKQSPAAASTEKDTGIFKQFSDGIASRQVTQQGMELFAKNLRYEGRFRITIPGDSFARAPDLLQTHAPDPTTHRIALDVPIEGNIYEITLSQAEDIYVKGRRHD
jgi:hypothetical protein